MRMVLILRSMEPYGYRATSGPSKVAGEQRRLKALPLLLAEPLLPSSVLEIKVYLEKSSLA